MSKVLILGGRAPAALDHARRFAHQGWRVYVADSVSCSMSAWSGAVAGSVRLPPPRFAPAAYVAELSRAITALGIDLVVPTCEEVFYLARYRQALPAACRIAVDDFDKLRSLHSKWEFQKLARDCGGNAPASALVENLDQARAWAAGEPLVLKPEFSRFGVHVRVYRHGVPANAPELALAGKWVAQRVCQGQEICSYSVAERGRLLAHAAYLPKYRLHGSSSYYFEPYASEAIAAFVARFVERHAFTGQIGFDWFDSGNGQPAVIECNPRAVSGLHLFGLADPLPAILAGAASEPVCRGGERARMLGPLMWTAGFADAIARNDLRGWRADLRAADDVLAGQGDTAPLAGATVDLAAYAAAALRQRCSLRQAATRDIEWDGEALEDV